MMLEILQLYVSGFWVWLGITIGLGLVFQTIVKLIIGSLAALRGTPIHFGDVNKEIKK